MELFTQNLPFNVNSNLKLIEKIAIGGFGVIFKSFFNGQYVAAKVEEIKNRSSISEKKCLTSINNSGIDSLPSFIDIIEVEQISLRIIVLPLYNKNLYEYTQSKPNKYLNIDELAIVNISVLKALNYLNTFQYIYNDLKETNLMLRYDYLTTDTIVLIDFGSVTTFSNSTSTLENVDITPSSSALWIHENTVNTYVGDLFSLGIMNFRLTKKKNPWDLPGCPPQISLYLNKISFLRNFDNILIQNFDDDDEISFFKILYPYYLDYKNINVPNYSAIITEISTLQKTESNSILSMESNLSTLCFNLSLVNIDEEHKCIFNDLRDRNDEIQKIFEKTDEVQFYISVILNNFKGYTILVKSKTKKECLSKCLFSNTPVEVVVVNAIIRLIDNYSKLAKYFEKIRVVTFDYYCYSYIKANESILFNNQIKVDEVNIISPIGNQICDIINVSKHYLERGELNELNKYMVSICKQ